MVSTHQRATRRTEGMLVCARRNRGPARTGRTGVEGVGASCIKARDSSETVEGKNANRLVYKQKLWSIHSSNVASWSCKRCISCVQVLIIEACGVNQVDSTGFHMIEQLASDCKDRGIRYGQGNRTLLSPGSASKSDTGVGGYVP